MHSKFSGGLPKLLLIRKSYGDIETHRRDEKRQRRKIPCPDTPVLKTNPLPFHAQRGPLLHSPLPCANFTSPPPAIHNRAPLPPVPQLSFQGARGLTPSLTKSTLANWDAPAVARFRIVICKNNKIKNTPTHTADCKRHSSQRQPLLQRPPPQECCGAPLTCSLQTRTPRPSSLLVPNIPRGTKSPLLL